MKPTELNLEKLAEIIIETIKELSTTLQQPITPGLLRKALSRQKGFSELWEAPEITGDQDSGSNGGKMESHQLQAHQADGLELPSLTQASSREAQLRKLRDFRFDLLNQSLDKLGDEALSRASELRNALGQCSDPDQLLDMNPEILSILQLAFRQVGGELEQFSYLVQEIGKSLVMMETDLVASSSTVRDMYQKDTDFNNSLERNVQEISESVHVSKNLKDIKDFLATKLEGIREGIEQKRKQDDVQLRKAHRQIERLKQHVHEMKEEVSKVRSEAESLEKEVLQDPLTGIHNRRAYEKRVREDLHRYHVHGQVFSMLLIDIDHFKQVNDRYGHSAGDRCLEEFTRLIKNTLRGNDFLARYGGEEFIALLPGTDEQGIGTVSERLRQFVERARFMFRDQQIPITISIGGTHVRSGDQDAEAIFNRVDAALYRAKESGRNRVILI